MRQACCFKHTIRAGFIHCLPLLENTLILVPKGFGSLFKSITDNYKFEKILLNGAELEASLANFFCKLRTAFALIKFALACTKTRNTETKPPERNHRNHRNSRNETTETTGTTKTKPPERPKQNHRNNRNETTGNTVKRSHISSMARF